MHRFFSYDHGAGEQCGECFRQLLLGEPVGHRHEVVRPALLDDIALGELPEPRHDLGRRGLAEGFFDIGDATYEKVFDRFDHASMRARRTDNPYGSGKGGMDSR